MEKQEVIKELQRVRAVWDRIIPLKEQSTKIAADKERTLQYRAEEENSRYHQNPHIKISKELPTSQASEVEMEIAARHKRDCLAEAKKKLSTVRILVLLAALIGIIFTAVPHVSSIASDQLDDYAPFADSLGLTLREDVADFQSMIGLALAVFSIISQTLAVIFVSLAVSSLIKASACARVPELGRAHKGAAIAAMVIFGIFGCFTWFSLNPVGICAIIPAILVFFIMKGSVSKLDSSAPPCPTAEESARLEQAKAEDRKNSDANAQARKDANAKAQKAFETDKKKSLAEYDLAIEGCDRALADINGQLATLTKEVRSEIIPDGDNNPDTVAHLLNYLENGRADSLKEALHLVDLDAEREKDREMQTRIALLKLQNDLFIAELDREEEKRRNDQLIENQRLHNDHIRREQENHNRKVQDALDKLNEKLN